MNKKEYMRVLKQNLNTSSEDSNEILDEYETYFYEASQEGLTEEEICEKLERPEIVAQNVNDTLGVVSEEEVVIEFEKQLQGVKETLKNIDLKSIEESAKQMVSATKGIIGESLINKIEKGDMYSMDFEEMIGMDKRDFSQGKKIELEFKGNEVKLEFTGKKLKKIDVEVISGDSKYIEVMTLPKELMVDVKSNDGVVTIDVPKQKIEFELRSRLRVAVPKGIEKLLVDSKIPLSINKFKGTMLDVKADDSPIVVKSVEVKDFNVNCEDGPIVVKDIKSDVANIVNGDGPITIKDIETKELKSKNGHGPIVVKNVDSKETVIILGSGPITVKNIEGDNLLLEMGSGPKSIKDIDVKEIELNSKAGILSLKNIHGEKLTGKLKSTMKSMKDIEVKDIAFE